MEDVLFVAGLVGVVSIALYYMRRDAHRFQRVPAMSTAEDWEKEGEGWKSQPEPEDTGAPGYYLPPARSSLFGSRIGKGCPKCVAMNALRAIEKLPPLRGSFKVRSSDLAVYCFSHDETFLPMPKGGLEAITVDKAA